VPKLEFVVPPRAKGTPRPTLAAALRGQARNVAGDLRVILRRRIRRYLLRDRRPEAVSYRHPQWVAEARSWLDGLAAWSTPVGGADGDRA